MRRIWGEAPANKRFGAYLDQKEQLWWQQFYGLATRPQLRATRPQGDKKGFLGPVGFSVICTNV